jgi:uncharacterized membrane protein
MAYTIKQQELMKKEIQEIKQTITTPYSGAALAIMWGIGILTLPLFGFGLLFIIAAICAHVYNHGHNKKVAKVKDLEFQLAGEK